MKKNTPSLLIKFLLVFIWVNCIQLYAQNSQATLSFHTFRLETVLNQENQTVPIRIINTSDTENPSDFKINYRLLDNNFASINETSGGASITTPIVPSSFSHSIFFTTQKVGSSVIIVELLDNDDRIIDTAIYLISSREVIITLNGPEEFFVKVGTPFNDPGATANSSIGNIDDQIIIDQGGYSNTVVGDYIFTYSVTFNGKVFSNSRIVHVSPNNVPIEAIRIEGQDISQFGVSFTSDFNPGSFFIEIDPVEADLNDLEIITLQGNAADISIQTFNNNNGRLSSGVLDIITFVEGGDVQVKISSTNSDVSGEAIFIFPTDFSVFLDTSPKTLNIAEQLTITPLNNLPLDNFIFEIENTSIATINQETLTITGLSVGNTNLTVLDRNGFFTSIPIEVNNSDNIIVLENIQIPDSIDVLLIGDLQILGIEFIPSDATNQDVTWTSSAPSIATVDQDGLITPLTVGEVTISVSSDIFPLSDSFTLSVREKIQGIAVTPNTLSIEVGEDITVVANVLPAGAFDTNVTWQSSDANIATVNSNGTIEAIAPGNAVITVSPFSEPDFSSTVTVTVRDPFIPVERIEITPISAAQSLLGTNETLQLTATVFPANATNKNITWSNANVDPSIPARAVVNNNGLVEGRRQGLTDIVVTSVSNPNISSRQRIRIFASPSVWDVNGDYFGIPDRNVIILMEATGQEITRNAPIPGPTTITSKGRVILEASPQRSFPSGNTERWVLEYDGATTAEFNPLIRLPSNGFISFRARIIQDESAPVLTGNDTAKIKIVNGNSNSDREKNLSTAGNTSFGRF